MLLLCACVCLYAPRTRGWGRAGENPLGTCVGPHSNLRPVLGRSHNGYCEFPSQRLSQRLSYTPIATREAPGLSLLLLLLLMPLLVCARVH